MSYLKLLNSAFSCLHMILHSFVKTNFLFTYLYDGLKFFLQVRLTVLFYQKSCRQENGMCTGWLFMVHFCTYVNSLVYVVGYVHYTFRTCYQSPSFASQKSLGSILITTVCSHCLHIYRSMHIFAPNSVQSVSFLCAIWVRHLWEGVLDNSKSILKPYFSFQKRWTTYIYWA